MYLVKKQYRGRAILLGSTLFTFPLDGSNPYDEKTCEKFPQLFECLSDSKPVGRKSRKADNGVGDSGVQGNKVDKVGRGRKRRSVSTEDSGSVSELKDVKSSPNAEESLSSLETQDGERQSTKED